jgi:hypothetical protein
MSYWKLLNISDMIGKYFTDVIVDKEDRNILFICKEGLYKMFHDQDCCETVYIESIVGDIADLMYNPILGAEEVITAGEETEDSYHSTHTFYKLKTKDGYVDIRWVGSSNGYYSEGVHLIFLPFKQEEDE